MAQAKADTGTDKYDIWVARGGVDENGRYWDTASTIAEAWMEANPQDRRSLEQVARWIIDTNHLKTIDGKDCHGNLSIAVVHKGQKVKLPEGNELSAFEVVYERLCVSKKELPPRQPEVQAEEPFAQFSPVPKGMVEYGLAMSRANFFLGVPPKDVAAERAERKGNRHGNRLKPSDSEGTYTKDDEGYDIVLRRAGRADGSLGELIYAPELTYYIDANGNAIVPNTKFEQKLEENARRMFDENGKPIYVVDGNALISINRRMNPDYAGIFKDERTAANRITEFSNTAEGLDVITAYAGIERAYGKTAASYKQSNSTQDARYLLELNVQMALNPIVWSVSHQGVPVIETEVIQTQMRSILSAHPELNSEFGSLVNLVSSPNKLDKATDRQKYRNYMDEWAQERAELDFIKKGYTQKDNGHYVNAKDGSPLNIPELTTPEIGAIFADSIQRKGSRAPTQFEIELGTGVAINSQRQAPDALAQAELDFVHKFRTDKAFATKVIKTAADTPGALQKLNDLLFHATRDDTDNQRLLAFTDKTSDVVSFIGFTNNGKAEDYAKAIALQLTGSEKTAKKMLADDPNIGDRLVQGLVRTATIGLVTIGKGENQNRGLFDAEPAIKNRINGYNEFGDVIDPALAAKNLDDVVSAYQSLAGRIEEGQNAGVQATDVGRHNFALVANPQAYQLREQELVAEDALRVNAKTSRVSAYRRGMDGNSGYQDVLAAAGPAMVDALKDAWVVNQNYAGNTNVIANIEAATEARIVRGEKVVGNVSDAQIKAAALAAVNGTSFAVTPNTAPTAAGVNTGKRGLSAAAYSMALLDKVAATGVDSPEALRMQAILQTNLQLGAGKDGKKGTGDDTVDAVYAAFMLDQLELMDGTAKGGRAKAEANVSKFFADNHKFNDGTTRGGRRATAAVVLANKLSGSNLDAGTVDLHATGHAAANAGTTTEASTVTFNGKATALDTSAIEAAVKSGDPKAMAQVMASANNATHGPTPEKMNAAIVSGLASSNAATFSMLVVDTALSSPEGYDSMLALIKELDGQDGRNVSRYADALRSQIKSVNDARIAAGKAGNPEIEDQAYMNALTAFTGFFGDGKHDAADVNSAKALSDLIVGDKALTSTFAGQFQSVNVGSDKAGFMNSLVDKGVFSREELTELYSFGGITNEATRNEKFAAWLAGHKDTLQAFTAHTGISYIEVIKLIVASQIPHKPGEHPFGDNPFGNCEGPDRSPFCPVREVIDVVIRD
jgi:hypothetical protein